MVSEPFPVTIIANQSIPELYGGSDGSVGKLLIFSSKAKLQSPVTSETELKSSTHLSFSIGISSSGAQQPHSGPGSAVVVVGGSVVVGGTVVSVSQSKTRLQISSHFANRFANRLLRRYDLQLVRWASVHLFTLQNIQFLTAQAFADALVSGSCVGANIGSSLIVISYPLQIQFKGSDLLRRSGQNGRHGTEVVRRRTNSVPRALASLSIRGKLNLR